MSKLPKTPSGTPRRGVGTRDLRVPVAQVLVLSPDGVPKGTDVTVDGAEGKLATGRPGPLSPGFHSLSVEHGGRLWFAEQEFEAQQPGDPPIQVRLAPFIEARLARVLRAAPKPSSQGKGGPKTPARRRGRSRCNSPTPRVTRRRSPYRTRPTRRRPTRWPTPPPTAARW